LFPNRDQCLWKALFDIYRIYGNIESGNSSIRQFIYYIDSQQAGVGGQVDPKILLGGVVGDALDQVRPQKRLAAHVGKHAATGTVQPVDRSFGRIFRHPFDLVVKGPTVVAVEIAFEFRKQICDQWMEVARSDPGTDVGKEPATHRMVDLTWFPMALVRRIPVRLLIDSSQQIGMLWKNWVWKSLRLPDRL